MTFFKGRLRKQYLRNVAPSSQKPVPTLPGSITSVEIGVGGVTNVNIYPGAVTPDKMSGIPMAAQPYAEPGRKGPQGYDGAPGAKGRDGVIGRDGAPGRQGDDGKRGPEGFGFPGAKGDPGAAGTAGVQGNQGRPGWDGTRGPEGWRGPPGERGPVGATGAPGASGGGGGASMPYYYKPERSETFWPPGTGMSPDGFYSRIAGSSTSVTGNDEWIFASGVSDMDITFGNPDMPTRGRRVTVFNIGTLGRRVRFVNVGTGVSPLVFPGHIVTVVFNGNNWEVETDNLSTVLAQGEIVVGTLDPLGGAGSHGGPDVLFAGQQGDVLTADLSKNKGIKWSRPWLQAPLSIDPIRGSEGARGPQGATGPTGATGANGAAGVKGADGLPGTDGVTKIAEPILPPGEGLVIKPTPAAAAATVAIKNTTLDFLGVQTQSKKFTVADASVLSTSHIMINQCAEQDDAVAELGAYRSEGEGTAFIPADFGLTINAPAGIVEGDLLVVFITHADGAGNPSKGEPTASGWNFLSSRYGLCVTYDHQSWIGVRFATANEPASYRFQFPGVGVRFVGWGSITAWTNGASRFVGLVGTQGATTEGTKTATHAFPSTITIRPYEQVVLFIGTQNNTYTAPPTGMTERLNKKDVGSGSVQGIWSASPATPTTYSVAPTMPSSELYEAFIMILRDFDGDENEVETMDAVAEDIAAGSFAVAVDARDGPVTGPYRFNYLIG